MLDQYVVNLEQTLNIYVGKLRNRVLQKQRRISISTKRLCDLSERSHLLAENRNSWIYLEFSNYCVCHTFALLSRKLTFATLMVLGKIPHVYKTDAAHILITSDKDNFTLPLLPLTLKKKDDLRHF